MCINPSTVHPMVTKLEQRYSTANETTNNKSWNGVSLYSY